MTPERYKEIWENDSSTLTDAELKEGWHFCPELDYALDQASGKCEFCDFDATRPIGKD